MKRRKFVGVLGALAALPLVPGAMEELATREALITSGSPFTLYMNSAFYQPFDILMFAGHRFYVLTGPEKDEDGWRYQLRLISADPSEKVRVPVPSLVKTEEDIFGVANPYPELTDKGYDKYEFYRKNKT